jgi:oxygen-independent coproporphyrinogen-3 oxidase
MSNPTDTGPFPVTLGQMPTVPAHLYVHVPLCAQKCSYCDFYSVAAAHAPVSPSQVADGLLNQAFAWLERGLAPRPLETLYVGGGTPTVLRAYLPPLVARLTERFGVAAGAEVTVEANPDSLDAELCDALADAGVTRVSVGVQSLDAGELATLGRRHDPEQALRAAKAVRAAGLALSVDLMCGLPGQALRSWARTLTGAIGTGAEHISVYPLSLEAGTPLAAAAVIGEVEGPDPDVAADLLLAAEQMLTGAGFRRYEVASYARPGAESRHNSAYWTGREYLGVGPGAHGMLAASTARAAGILVPEGAGAARVRYSVACDLDAGMTVMPRIDIEVLTGREALREDVMLGLRLSRGVAQAAVEGAGVTGALERLVPMGLVERAEGCWRLTRRGWLLANEVFGAVWAGE